MVTCTNPGFKLDHFIDEVMEVLIWESPLSPFRRHDLVPFHFVELGAPVMVRADGDLLGSEAIRVPMHEDVWDVEDADRDVIVIVLLLLFESPSDVGDPKRLIERGGGRGHGSLLMVWLHVCYCYSGGLRYGL